MLSLEFPTITYIILAPLKIQQNIEKDGLCI